MSEPIQARARETEELLLQTAEELLRKGGVEACTMPELSRLSGRSIGALYRRFPDKDALLRKVFRRYLQWLEQQNLRDLDCIAAANGALTERVPMIVRSMVASRRRDRKLLAALQAYLRVHPDKAFRREMQRMFGATLARLQALLMERVDDIDHPDPVRAVETALAVLAVSVQGLSQREEMSWISEIGEGALVAELTRMVLAYLGDRAR
jgi:AcrR family transcriptional regulator